MQALPTLLRLARQELDTLRRALGELQGRRATILLRIQTHGELVVREQEIARQRYEVAHAYVGFAAAALEVKRAMESEAAVLEQEAEGLRGLIGAAHIEVKKLERLLELQEARAADKARRVEDAELDELAMQRAARARDA